MKGDLIEGFHLSRFMGVFSLLCTCIYFLSPAAKYDAEKEAKERKEAKNKQLAEIEEARRKAAEGKGVYFHKG